VEACAKQAAELEGQWPLSELDRLLASVHPETASAPDPVAWRAVGEQRKSRGGDPEFWLHVAAQGRVMMECQRCLKPVATSLSVERAFLFVRGEEAAAALDAESEADVLALTRALDLRLLVEDELLLALPLVPRHEVCPQPLPLQNEELSEDDAPHPFAALAALKGGGLPN